MKLSALSALLGLSVVALAGCGPSPQAPASPAPSPSAPSSTETENQVEKRARLVAAVRTAPNDPQAALQIALFDWQAGKDQEAEQELLALWKGFPQYAEGPYQLGALYLTQGRNAEALPPLQAAIRLDGKKEPFQEMAGLACFRLGRMEEARRYTEKAQQLAPNAPAPYLMLARIESNGGTAQKAMDALKEYFKRSKEPAPGYYLMGRLYYRQSDASNAEKYLLQATQAAPNNPDYWAMLGHVYVDLQNGKRLTEGLACYEKALALRSQDWETLAALGRAEMQQQKWESAIAHLKSALRYAPDPGPLLYSLGQALLRGGHEEEGRRTLAEYQDYLEYSRGVAKFKREVEAAPRDRARRYAWARYCLQYGQRRAARTVLEEAERLLGADAESRSLLAEAKNGQD